jgi:cytochrome c biogenesis protein CcmG/thiol:disulfide interchange protein DsbE
MKPSGPLRREFTPGTPSGSSGGGSEDLTLPAGAQDTEEKGPMIRGWHLALVLGIVGLVALFYKGLWGDPRAIPTVLVGTQAPVFSGPEVNSGAIISLDDYKGKVVMMNFWASWCLECREEHQNLLAIQKRYSGNPHFVLVGINYQDQEEDARKYLETYGNSFQHVRDMKGSISIDYGVYGVPETFVMDQQGIIRFKHIGPIIGPAYTHLTEKVIDPLLEGKPLSPL